MRKIWTLIKREYVTRIRTKGFLWGTLLMPVFILLVTFFPLLLGEFTGDDVKNIAIIDRSGALAAPLHEAMQNDGEGKEATRYHLHIHTPDAAAWTETVQLLDNQVKDKKLDAYLIIPEDIFESNQFELHCSTVSNLLFNRRIENAVTQVATTTRLQRSGLDAELVKKFSARINAKTYKVGEQGSREESGFASYAVNYIFMFLLYIALILYGTFVMQGVTEDKSSRVMEILLSSANARQIMAGKILGIGAVGLTQFFIWMLFAALASMYGLAMVQAIDPGISKIAMPTISIWVYVLFLVYFILGFFLYATLYAAVGSMVNSDREAQSLQWPVVMLILFAMLCAFPVLQNPSGTFAIVISLLPFFTPILMFLRFTANAATTVELLASILIMILTTWGLIWVTAKIFRVGILMYGKKPTLQELLKWMKYS